MFLEDEPHPSSDRKALTPELLDQFKSERQRLAVQARELERLREQVRSSAEREAAAIVTAARRNVRQVLVDARRELLVLVAQLQAVGCDASRQDAESRIVEGQVPTLDAALPPAAENAPDSNAGAALTGARRDVREVLLEAQAELLALSEEARELRARIARQHETPREPPVVLPDRAPEPGAESEPELVVPEAAHVQQYASEREQLAPEIEPTSEPAAVASLEPEPSREYATISSPSRVWVAVAAAVVLGVMGVGLYMLSARRTPSGVVASQPSKPAPPEAAPREPAPVPVASTGPAPAAVDPSLVTVHLDVRRPAWIRTTIDGRADIGRVFAAGETRSVTGNREVVLRAGDAGAVFVSVNGGAARALGPDGQVITRRFARPAPPAPAPAETTRAAAPETPRSLGLDAPPADIGTTGASESAAPQNATAEREILRATQRWFEAYFGGDSVGMNDIATSDFSIVDDRPEGQRFPPTMRGVDRGLQQVRIEVAGESAVMSARLTERAQVNGQLHEYVALVSAAWVRTDGRWRLMGVRFADPGQEARARPF